MRGVMQQFRKIDMAVEDIARQFPKAAGKLKQAKELLTGAMMEIVQTTQQPEGAQAPPMLR